MEVREIVAAWLKDHGYDGLYSDECGCIIDGLMPCGETDIDCTPGVIIQCKNECNSEYTTCLSSSKNADCPYGCFTRQAVKDINDRKSDLYNEMVAELKSMSQYLANKDLAAIKSRSGYHLAILRLLKKAQELEYEIGDVVIAKRRPSARSIPVMASPPPAEENPEYKISPEATDDSK